MFPVPKSVEVHTGSEDWQSHPDAVTKFFRLLGVSAVVAEGRGDSLGEDYVAGVLNRSLAVGGGCEFADAVQTSSPFHQRPIIIGADVA